MKFYAPELSYHKAGDTILLFFNQVQELSYFVMKGRGKNSQSYVRRVNIIFQFSTKFDPALDFVNGMHAT